MDKFELKYPVLLIHGMGFRDDRRINYWGRIPKALEEMGCKIFYGNQDSNASIETNGRAIKKRIEEILQERAEHQGNSVSQNPLWNTPARNV